MARQTIPRFDLYTELGVNPSADEATIEAAYRAAMERRYPDVDPADDRRTVRLRLARAWLTDPERRNRYDASRSRAAGRAAGGRKSRSSSNGALAGLDAAASDNAAPAEADAATIPWPVADLRRFTEAAAEANVLPRRSRRPAVVGLGIIALALVVATVVVALVTHPAPGGVAGASPTASPAPVATATTAPPSPSPEATVLPTIVPATTVPIDVAALQQAASNTIAALATAAAAGDVATAQTMLGDSAPGLRASGLRRATFPDVQPTNIVVTQGDAGYLAAANGDLLTSIDGITWTFNYGDRPLAAYRSPSGEPVHDLWWVESDGEHHLYLQVGVATISRSGVTVKVDWTFSPSRPDDATYFRRAELVISSVSLDDIEASVTAEALRMAGVTTLTPTASFNGGGSVPERLTIELTLTNPRTAGGPGRPNPTTFNLRVR